MRFIGPLFFICLFLSTSFSQQSGNGSVAGEAPKVVDAVVRDTDQEALEKAIAIPDARLRADALIKFIGEYPESELIRRASEQLSGARATLGDISLRTNKTAEGLEMFRLAVKEAPLPMSDDLFSKVLVNIPTNLFLLGQRNAAFEIADQLERLAASDHRQLLRLATFYVDIKYATGARQLAEKAIALDPLDPLGYQTLGIAHRLGFNLSGAGEAYSKVLELQPESLSARQNLAEMKRALGQPVDAELLYREILDKDPEDVPARTGLILSLFDQNRKLDAEPLLLKERLDNPSNGFVLIGAAQYYVANGDPDLAIEYANQALTLDESAVWAYLIAGRAYMKKNAPLDAERTFLAALKIAKSPTLSYELALARCAVGFYAEAAEELSQYFRVEDGMLVTDLDGRIGVEAENFSDLISLERKNMIFTPAGGYDNAGDAQLKALFVFETVASKAESTDTAISESVDRFIAGDDQMKTFRRLYAAGRLLDYQKIPQKANEIAQDAVSGVEEAVEVPDPAAAVMADQLVESRRTAAASGRTVLIPEIDKTLLVRIMRGRIEEIAGRSLIAVEDFAAAEVRLKRAINILPKDSAWWRSTVWRLGAVYEKTGNDRLALDNYAASYASGDIISDKRNTVEAMFLKVNGSMAGFDEFLADKRRTGVRPASQFTKTPVEVPVPARSEENTATTATQTTVVTAAAVKEPEIKRLPEDIDLTMPDAADTINAGTAKPTVLNVEPAESDVAKTETSKPFVPVTDEPAKPKTVLPETLVPLLPVSEPTPKTGVSVAAPVTAPEIVRVIKEPVETVPVENAQNEVLEEPAGESIVDPVSDEKAVVTEKPVVEDVQKGVTADPSVLIKTQPAVEADRKPVEPLSDRTVADLIDLGATRPRFVSQEKIRLPDGSGEPQPCRVVSSQDTLSIIANGGSLGLVIGVENYDAAYVLRARSEFPEDVSITYEPDIGSLDGRAFFVIKSISNRKGEMKVYFETPCGDKIVVVDVH